MSALRIAIVFWSGFFLALGPLRSAGDGDIFWQRWLGDLVLRTHHIPMTLGSETFTSTGSAWIPQEWVFSVLVALATDRGAFALLALVVSAVPATILVSVYLRSRTTAKPEAIAIALFLCGLALAESFGIRAQVLGWGCLAAFLSCIERRDRWYYASIPITVVWANLHASAFIAPAILLARLAGTVTDGGGAALKRSRDLRSVGLVVLATLCTPFGWHLPVYAFTLIESPIRHFIVEWQPPRFTDPSFLGALALAAFAGITAARTFRRDKQHLIPAAMLFVMALSAGRNVPLFAIAVAPLAARGVPDVRGMLTRFGKSLQAMEAFALTPIAAVVVSCALLLSWSQRHEPPRLPVAAIAALSATHHERRIFCENFAWCSIALQYPRFSVFIDGRCDPYPLGVWQSYVATAASRRSWTETLKRYRVNAVVASRIGRLGSALAADRSWRLAFEDARYVVYTRAT
jgi:hypothetical protein